MQLCLGYIWNLSLTFSEILGTLSHVFLGVPGTGNEVPKSVPTCEAQVLTSCFCADTHLKHSVKIRLATVGS